ncbi:hypothetical protein N7534_009486 [Penicillium rubens]|nr:hypothetical protein N7534_009486 [Penicillium rubens]
MLVCDKLCQSPQSRTVPTASEPQQLQCLNKIIRHFQDSIIDVLNRLSCQNPTPEDLQVTND